MHVLLTNDDGIDAPGLAALEAAFQGQATVTVAAPHRCYSGCGHQVNYREPLRVQQEGDRRFRVHGSPADCVRVGLTALTGGRNIDGQSNVDLVLSGINEGGNMGVDIYMSGTVAAVREAVWLGTPGVAFSQYFLAERQRDWDKAAAMALQAFQHIQSRTNEGGFWNVNLPDVDTAIEKLRVTDTFVEPNHMPIAYEPSTEEVFELRSDYRNRKREAGSDVEVCMGRGEISISHVPAV